MSPRPENPMSPDYAALARALRGPAIMITLGLLFLLNNFTRFGFEETWPAILIVVGALSLIGYGRRDPRSGDLR